VASPVIKLSSKNLRLDSLLNSNSRDQYPGLGSVQERDFLTEFLSSLPCVIYECDLSLNVTFVSGNAIEIIGVRAQELLGRKALWEERVPRDEQRLLSEKFEKLISEGSASVIHRIIDDHGLPVWVSHSFQRDPSADSKRVRGCIIPLRTETRTQNLDQTVISRFIHKIGNHFQLLNLLIDSLRRTLPDSNETELIQQTVEKAVELTRTFSDYTQSPTWLSEVDLVEILHAAIHSRKSSYAGKGVALEDGIDGSVNGVTVQSDPFLLELAIGCVLQNALEATDYGGKVILDVKVELLNNVQSIVRLRIVDTGCGMKQEVQRKAAEPFFTMKSDRDGLGLSMASRFIEIHGGVLRIESREGKGTTVEILLPTVTARCFPDR
jgi:PAS domain S-box-containing protein